MGKLVLFGHGGSGNHGCEAIVRATAGLVPGRELVLISQRPEEDRRWGLDALAEICPEREKVRRGSPDFIRAYAALKLRRDYLPMDELTCKAAFSHIRPGDTALSIGGDNYCYGENEKYAMLHRLAKDRDARTVLWGCSVEREAVRDPATARDLKGFDLICARESVSFETLVEINPQTILTADPAFCLPCAPTALPGDMENTVGINVSPLLLARERVGGVVMESVSWLIRQILAQTQMRAALIPHVTWPGSDDRAVLGELYGMFRDTGRVMLVPERSCAELKTVISQCRFFLGARTHAGIAACSTGVPTLMLGYSVKARGIARDLFGSEAGHVLPVQTLEDPDTLTRAFFAMTEREGEERRQLQRVLPEMLRRARAAGERL